MPVKKLRYFLERSLRLRHLRIQILRVRLALQDKELRFHSGLQQFLMDAHLCR